MTVISARHANRLSLLLLPAVCILVFQSYFREFEDDCVNANRLYDVAKIEGTLEAREEWSKHNEVRMQWTEGEIAIDPEIAEPLKFRIVRSRNPKPLYRSPTNFLREEIAEDWGETVRVDAGGFELPIHKIYGHDESDVLVGAYMFVYDAQPVANPYLTQLRTVLSQLVSGGRPLTLFTVTGAARGDRFEAVDHAAMDWLASAWRYYESVCRR